MITVEERLENKIKNILFLMSDYILSIENSDKIDITINKDTLSIISKKLDINTLVLLKDRIHKLYCISENIELVTMERDENFNYEHNLFTIKPHTLENADKIIADINNLIDSGNESIWNVSIKAVFNYRFKVKAESWKDAYEYIINNVKCINPSLVIKDEENSKIVNYTEDKKAALMELRD